MPTLCIFVFRSDWRNFHSECFSLIDGGSISPDSNEYNDLTAWKIDSGTVVRPNTYMNLLPIVVMSFLSTHRLIRLINSSSENLESLGDPFVCGSFQSNP